MEEEGRRNYKADRNCVTDQRSASWHHIVEALQSYSLLFRRQTKKKKKKPYLGGFYVGGLNVSEITFILEKGKNK